MLNILHWKSRQSAVGGKLFSSYWTLFALAQVLRDSKPSDLNFLYEALVKKEAFTICHLGYGYLHYFCVLSLSSLLEKGSYIHLYYDTSLLGSSNPREKITPLSSLAFPTYLFDVNMLSRTWQEKNTQPNSILWTVFKWN